MLRYSLQCVSPTCAPRRIKYVRYSVNTLLQTGSHQGMMAGNHRGTVCDGHVSGWVVVCQHNGSGGSPPLEVWKFLTTSSTGRYFGAEPGYLPWDISYPGARTHGAPSTRTDEFCVACGHTVAGGRHEVCAKTR